MTDRLASSSKLIDDDIGETKMEKTSSVLHKTAFIDQRKMGGNSYVFFTYDDPNEALPRLRKYEMDIETFEEMGNPEVITVTAVPGDTLNTESENGRGN